MPRQPVNYWPQSRCARAYWSQHELPTYQELLADTRRWLEPQAGQHWLDLGCGGGQLTRALWQDSRGTLAEIVGMDCASVNEAAFLMLRQELRPPPAHDRLRFVNADFATGLPTFADRTFDGVVSGLSIQYAESYSVAEGRWTSAAYNRVLAEVFRILQPGGRFVFSVNVPNPSWGRVGWHSFAAILRSPNPAQFLWDGLLMWRYGAWVKREAARGRFHYLPIATIQHKLTQTGFVAIEHRLTYAGQAYLVRCRKLR
jgi:ubiquinone/menaquinone biosynthesis C-methylase UbiE